MNSLKAAAHTKLDRQWSRCRCTAKLWWLPVLVLGSFGFGQAAPAEKLTLKRAVQLALVHSSMTGQATADERRADASFREARDGYIPQLMVGSGLGETWGYPLSLEGSAPSLVNITAQSALFNPSLRDNLRAARREYQSVLYGNKDRRSQIIQDTTLSYIELSKWEDMIGQLRQQQDDALKMEQVAEQRVEAGIDNPQMRTQAKLGAARAKLHLFQAEGAMQSLRLTLSHLTGLQVASIATDRYSVPAFPQLSSDPDAATTAADASPAVLFAQQHALAMGFRARAEHRALLPTADFAAQYAVLAKFNNWLQFFPTQAFERNNATIGVVLRFPFFNSSQHAHAQAADAEAARATAEVQSTRNQISEQVLKVQSSVKQLAAAKEVSELEFELAKSSFDEVEVRMSSGGATIHDEANARADMSEKYNQLQDADFELARANVALLRLSGDLDSWIGLPK